MIYFKYSELLYLLILTLPMFYFMKKNGKELNHSFSDRVVEKIRLKGKGIDRKSRNILFIFAFIFAIFAIARPQIDNGEVKVKSSFINVVVGIDISHSMFANDIYPNRFEFAKNKFFELLDNLENSKVALLNFSSQAFLVSPLTKDFSSLKFLTKNMRVDYLNLRGTDILATLEASNRLFGEEAKKVLLLFTDGGDSNDFTKEIEYAKKHNISIFIYNIATDKGGVIKTEDGVIKDKNGDIVVVRLNEKIKELAMQSGGAYMKYSLSQNDIKALSDVIKAKFKAKEEAEETLKDTKEMFYYPLSVAILLFLLSLISLPRSAKWDYF